MIMFLGGNLPVPMLLVILLSSLLSLLSLRPQVVLCHNGQVVPLTYYNLIKVVKKFPCVVVNLDEKYPMVMQKKHEYEEFADEFRITDNLLVGKMDIPYLGQDIDNENSIQYEQRKEYEFAQKLNATDRDEFPILFLFVNHDMDHPIRFETEQFNRNTIKDFVRSHSPPQVKFLCTNCIEELDDMAVDFVRANMDQNKRKDIWSKAEQLLKQKYNETENGQIYTKLMERILERGDIYIESENERVKNLLKSNQVKENKKQWLQNRLNILDTFRWATTTTTSTTETSNVNSMAQEKQEL